MMFYKETEFQDTSMGRIPKDWEVLRVEDLGEVITGTTPSTSHEEYWNGAYPFVTPTDITESKYVRTTERKVTQKGLQKGRLLPKDSVLVTCIASIGKIALSYEPCITNQQINAIICNKEVDPHYVHYALKFRANVLQSWAGRTTNPIVKKSLFEKFQVSLPRKVDEQRRIVDVLGVVDSAIGLVDEVIWKTERLKKGLMQQLLTRGIGHKEYKDTPIGRIPKTWDVVRYKQACERIFVGIATSSTKHFCDQGVPLIRNQNIREGSLDLSDLVYITEDFSEMNRSRMLKENDILSVRTGYPGLSCKVTKEMEGWHTFTTLIGRPNLSEFSPDFLVCVLNSPLARSQILRLQAGLAQQNLNVSWIAKLRIPKPPIEEQQKISNILMVAAERTEVEKKTGAKLRRVKMGLMDLLLTGKVRVKVD